MVNVSCDIPQLLFDKQCYFGRLNIKKNRREMSYWKVLAAENTEMMYYLCFGDDN